MTGKEKDELRVAAADFFPLVEEVLDSGMEAIFAVAGFSMWPLICSRRDSVLVKPVSGDSLKKRDIVLLRTADGCYLLHRVIRLFEHGFETAGDGNVNEDGVVFPYACLLARVTKVYRPHTTINCDSAFWRAAAAVWVFLFPVRGTILKAGRGLYKLLHGKRS